MFIAVSGAALSGHCGVGTRSKGGKMMVMRGYYINLVELGGHTPATFGQKLEVF